MLVERNIWNKFGCELPSGSLCNACCIFYEVLLGNKVKPAGEPCLNIDKTADGNGGCVIYDERFPECEKGGCFPATLPNRALDLIATALDHDLVAIEEARAAVLGVCDIQNKPHLFDKAMEYVLTKF